VRGVFLAGVGRAEGGRLDAFGRVVGGDRVMRWEGWGAYMKLPLQEHTVHCIGCSALVLWGIVA